METGTASCFTLLAADRPQRPPFARPTSPLKTRVRGFCAGPSGRFSSRGRRTRKSQRVAGRAAYKTASGRGKWPNRDPLGDLGFMTLQTDGRLQTRLLPPGERLQAPNLYEFVVNDPISKRDPLGLDWASDYSSCLQTMGYDAVCGFGGAIFGPGSMNPTGIVGKICRRGSAALTGWCTGVSYGCMMYTLGWALQPTPNPHLRRHRLPRRQAVRRHRIATRMRPRLRCLRGEEVEP